MNLGEYEAMYRVEKDHWWYKGLRDLLFYWTGKCLEGRSPGQVKILDAGCGTGINLHEHEKWGANMWGIDASSEAVAFTQKRGAKNVSEALIQNLPFDDHFFDIIYSMDVIFMLPESEVKKAFIEFRRCLKPNGKLLINSATLHFLYSSHDIACNAVSRHSKKLVETLLNEAGFVIVKSTYRLFFLFPVMAAVKLIQKFGLQAKRAEDVKGDLEKTNPLVNFILYPILKLENALLKTIDLPIGVSLFVVAEVK
jgi:ubiquinone/menaquinone biosynthesis C-methylase UbiE